MARTAAEQEYVNALKAWKALVPRFAGDAAKAEDRLLRAFKALAREASGA